MLLKNDRLILRALEPEDLNLLYVWENDPENWSISNTISPFSKYTLEQFIAASQQDIYATRQMRLIICEKKTLKAIGCIDLFDFDPLNKRAGIGILIGEKDFRKKGYASGALELIIDYCFNKLDLHQLFCNIGSDNNDSLKLFENHQFKICGLKKQWLKTSEGYSDEYTLQLIAGVN